jgi:hypothetical protein
MGILAQALDRMKAWFSRRPTQLAEVATMEERLDRLDDRLEAERDRRRRQLDARASVQRAGQR